MNTKLLLEYSLFVDLFITAGILVVMGRKRLLRSFAFLTGFLVVNCMEEASSILLLFFRKSLGLSGARAYEIYFYSRWIISGFEYALLLLIIYSVFREAMKPLEGLHRAGKIVFRWVGGVSIALSVVLALGPHAAGSSAMATLYSQIQQGISVLILCLLLFGVSLGLGVFACVSLVESAWTASGAQTLYAPVFVFSALGSCATLLTWGTYFALPAPERKMILLPTTSPFFLWNRISEALGDEPGFVAIAGFKPEMLAAAELTAFTAGSKRAREREMEQERAVRDQRETESAQAAQQSLGIHSLAMQR
jgi:hypothetical protein